MTDALRIATAPDPLPERLLADIADLYNRTQAEVYGFFPLTPERFARRVCDFHAYRPDLFFHAFEGERLVGMLHAGLIRQPGYEPGGTVEMVGVDPACRGRGIGGRLLDAALAALHGEKGLLFVDGGGAFPNSPFYSTLLNGSERSGVELDASAAMALFASRGFEQDRQSIIMRAELGEELPALPQRIETLLADSDRQEGVRRPNETWFDQVFRGWTLTESRLYTPYRQEPVTRAVYVPMRDVSVHEGRNVYGVFAVNTHTQERGRGWATAHFRILRRLIRARGGEVLELHVYADNLPAVRLYAASGFREVKRTVILRLPLSP